MFQYNSLGSINIGPKIKYTVIPKSLMILRKHIIVTVHNQDPLSSRMLKLYSIMLRQKSGSLHLGYFH